MPVLTPRVDIANARLRFASGLIANLTASRVSLEKVRKFRVFAPRTYVSADFTAREAQVYRLEADEGAPRIAAARQGAPDQEPLRLQIEAFAAGGPGPLPAARLGRGRPPGPGPGPDHPRADGRTLSFARCRADRSWRLAPPTARSGRD